MIIWLIKKIFVWQTDDENNHYLEACSMMNSNRVYRPLLDHRNILIFQTYLFDSKTVSNNYISLRNPLWLHVNIKLLITRVKLPSRLAEELNVSIKRMMKNDGILENAGLFIPWLLLKRGWRYSKMCGYTRDSNHETQEMVIICLKL